MKLRLMVFLVGFMFPPVLARAQGILEVPRPGAIQSGVGVVSGWKCAAGAITIRFDGGPPIAVPYGSSRDDTRFICENTENGFALQWNYNLLTEGEHLIEVFDEGERFASAAFTVTKIGAEFLSGRVGSCEVDDFPFPGERVVLEWQEASQNFVIAQWEGNCYENTDCGATAYCQKSRGDCKGQGRCRERPTACDLSLHPVCGCDGKTHGNPCFVAGAGINVAHDGTCDGQPYVPERKPR